MHPRQIQAVSLVHPLRPVTSWITSMTDTLYIHGTHLTGAVNSIVAWTFGPGRTCRGPGPRSLEVPILLQIRTSCQHLQLQSSCSSLGNEVLCCHRAVIALHGSSMFPSLHPSSSVCSVAGFRANFQRGDVTKDPRAGSIHVTTGSVHVTTGSVHVTTGSVHVTASGSDGPARSKRGPGPGPRSDPVPKSKSQGPCNYGQ